MNIRNSDVHDGTFLDRWQARRERVFLERREMMSGWFPRLRNRASRRRLVVVYLAMVFALLVAGILFAATLLDDGSSAWWGLPWIVFTVLLVGTWTTLVIVTDNLDGAPLADPRYGVFRM